MPLSAGNLHNRNKSLAQVLYPHLRDGETEATAELLGGGEPGVESRLSPKNLASNTHLGTFDLDLFLASAAIY